MKPLMQVITFSGGLFLCSLTSAQSYTGNPPLSKGEALQLSQDMSPKARAQLSRREAYAAYNEAQSACKSMGKSERKDCTAEAKKNLRSDLNYAKEIRTSGASMGGSGSSYSAGGGSISGANDLSSAGGSSGSAGGSTGAMTGTHASGNDRAGGPPVGLNNQTATGASDEKLTAAEKKQFVQSFTPQAQYKLATREAHAAYNEALKTCKSMPKADRTSCTNEARVNLKNDMAYAKSRHQQDKSESSGESGRMKDSAR